MKRASFLKSLLGIAVAPKVLAEVDSSVAKDVPYKGKYAKSLLESTRFIDKQELFNSITYRVGDHIRCVDEEGFYVVTLRFADDVKAMYMNNSKPPVNFKLGDKRFAPIFTACKENS